MESTNEGKITTAPLGRAADCGSTLKTLISQEAGRALPVLEATESLAEDLIALESMLKEARFPKVVFSENMDAMRKNSEATSREALDAAHKLIGKLIGKSVY